MEKMRAAVIGCGRIASVYKEVFRKMEDLEVVLALDKAETPAREFATAFPGCKWSTDTSEASVRKLLTEIKPDVVHILLPHHLHRLYTIIAIECGCNVLTEKPIALSMEDADAMIQAAQINRKQLGVIFQNRYITGVQEAKRILKSGELGKVKGAFSNLNWYRPPSYYACDWKGKWETEGGGVVIDQAIHSIDLVRYLLDEEAVEIDGHYSCRVLKKRTPQVEVEDEADAAITFSGGAVYSFFATNYYTVNTPIQIEISCDNGTVHIEHQTVTVTSPKGIRIIEQNKENSESGEHYWGTCHYLQVRDFYDRLRKGETVLWTPEDAAKTLEIVLGIYQSCRKGCPLRL